MKAYLHLKQESKAFATTEISSDNWPSAIIWRKRHFYFKHFYAVGGVGGAGYYESDGPIEVVDSEVKLLT